MGSSASKNKSDKYNVREAVTLTATTVKRSTYKFFISEELFDYYIATGPYLYKGYRICCCNNQEMNLRSNRGMPPIDYKSIGIYGTRFTEESFRGKSDILYDETHNTVSYTHLTLPTNREV